MITVDVARGLVGNCVIFSYAKTGKAEASVRWARFEQVEECKNGKTIVLAQDLDDNENYKSFNINNIVEVIDRNQQPDHDVKTGRAY